MLSAWCQVAGRLPREGRGYDGELVVNPPTPCKTGKHPPPEPPKNSAGQKGANGGGYAQEGREDATKPASGVPCSKPPPAPGKRQAGHSSSERAVEGRGDGELRNNNNTTTRDKRARPYVGFGRNPNSGRTPEGPRGKPGARAHWGWVGCAAPGLVGRDLALG